MLSGRPVCNSKLMCLPIMAGMLLLCAATPLRGQTLTTIYAFTGGADGANPFSGLVMDKYGNLYGTTYFGGLPNCSNGLGCGVVFEVTSTGLEEVLYRFTGGMDGANPLAGLVRIGNNLYGTTMHGGNQGLGTVFKLTTNGVETVLHSFTGGADGSSPIGNLNHDSLGNLYGTTIYGGDLSCVLQNQPPGCGVIFKMTHSGSETVLYSFTGLDPDGAAPFGGVTFDNAGNLYGTTANGGYWSGSGTVYELSSTGKETTLFLFGIDLSGEWPLASLIRDSKGNLFGTTFWGGNGGGVGTVFEVNPGGAKKTLHTFTGPDGVEPEEGQLLLKGNVLYGTTHAGGTYNYGTVFKLDANGVETLLHSFSSGADGSFPVGGLVMDKIGNLYGTTTGGGAYGYGTVFKLVP